MQTFLPYPDFADSAEVLDYRRLGKQRVEAKQILLALLYGGGWRNHPAVFMWEGFDFALAEYGHIICREWISRGYNDTLLDFFEQFRMVSGSPPKPFWFGVPIFHAAHRSNLLRKDPEYYSQFGWNEPPDLEYVWPSPMGVIS